MKTKRVLSIILPILFITSLMVPLLTISTTSTVSALPGWWDTSWSYRRAITISPLNPENYQIKVVIPSTIAKSDYPSIRFLENVTSGVLPYWIENNEGVYNSTAGTDIAWVRRLENDDNTIYMYYGNAGATRADNGDNTFIFFDDFGGGSGGYSALNSNKWSNNGQGIDVTQYVMHLDGGYDGTIWHDEGKGLTTAEENTPRTIEVRVKNSTTDRGGLKVYGDSQTNNNETACMFQKGGGEYRFWCKNFPSTSDGGYISQQNNPGDKWYLFTVSLYGASKDTWRAQFYWANDNSDYRGLVEQSAVMTGVDWAPPSPKVDTYKLEVWAGSYYFDWILVRKYADTTPVATVDSTATSPALLNPLTIPVYGVDYAQYGGSPFTNTNDAAANETSTTMRTDMRFVAQRNQSNVDNIGVAIATYTNQASAKLRLESDNGSGYPSGTDAWVGSETAYMNVARSSFLTGSLITPGSVTAGTIYHIVIQSDNADATHFYGTREYLPFNPRWIGGVTTNDSRNVLYSSDSGTTWVVDNREPVYFIKDTTNGTVDGNPYMGYGYFGIFGNSAAASASRSGYGEQFTLSSDENNIASVSLWLEIYPAGVTMPADNLHISIYDVTGAATVATATMTTKNVVHGGNPAWNTVSLDSPVNLIGGRTYQLRLTSPLDNSGTYWEVFALQTVANVTDYGNIGWGGQTNKAILSNDNGATWVDENTGNGTEVPFRLYTAGFAVSESISPSSQSGWGGQNLSYTVTVINAGNENDNFNLTSGDNAGWTLGLPSNTGNIKPGENYTGTLTVTVAGSPGASDNVWVKATSANDPTQSDNKSVIATRNVAGVTVSIIPTDNSGAPGDNVTFSVTVTNTGNATDNFNLVVTDTLGWTIGGTLPANTGAIASLGSQSYTLWAIIGIGTDNIKVKATSVGDGTINNSATCYAHASLAGGYWIPLAAFPGTVSGGVTMGAYAENNGVHYYYALEANNVAPFVLHNFYRLNLDTNTWENLYNAPAFYPASGGSMVWTHGDNIYVLGGGAVVDTGNWFFRYNISENTWDNLGAPYGTFVQYGANAGTCLAWDWGDNIYVAVNSSAAPIFRKIVAYHISTGTWDNNVTTEPGATIASGSSLLVVGDNLWYLNGGAATWYTENKKNLTNGGGLNSWAAKASALGNTGSGSQIENVGTDLIFAVRTGSSTDFTKYTISTDNWERENALLATISGGSKRLWANGTTLYLLRGYTDSSMWKYNVGRSVQVILSPTTQIGWSGDNLAYTVTVKNTGTFDDTFNLTKGHTAAGWTWGDNIPANTGNLAPMQSVTFTIWDVVAGAHGDNDNMSVQAVSANDATILDNKSVLSKNAVAGVTVSITPTDNQGAPGDNVKFNVTVTNTGNASDNFTLENTDTTGWTMTGLPTKIGPIAPLGSQTYTIGVIIALPKAIDNIKVKATSTGDNTVNNSANCYAHEVLAIVSMSPITPNPENGLPGDNLTWTVTVFNQWSTADNIALTVNDPLWGVAYVDNVILTIPAFSSRTTTLHENIPISAQGKQSNTITVTATSGNDNSVSASQSVTVNVTFVAGVDVAVLPSYQNGWTGDNLVYNFTVTNLGNGPDSFLVQMNDTLGWPFGSIPATTVSTSIGDIGDDGVQSGGPNTNNGGIYNMYVGYAPAYGNEWDYVLFPISSIPSGAVIQSATLRLMTKYGASNGPSFVPDNIWVEAWNCDADNSWNENTLTWNNRPQPDGNTLLDNVEIFATPGGVYTYYSWNVTSYIATQRAAGYGVVTINMRSNGVSDNGDPNNTLWFYTKDGNPSDRVPYLDITYSTVTGTLAPGGTYTGQAWTIVSSSMSNVDNLYFAARSVSNNTVSDNQLFQAHSADGAVAITIEPSTENGLPGETKNYTVTVTNNGQLTDNLLIVNLGDTQGWNMSLDNTLFSNVPVGENRTTTLHDNIPGGAIGGTIDNITLMGVEQGAGQTSQATCTAVVTTVYGVLVSIAPGSQSGSPGNTLVYTVTVTNTGNVSDTYTLDNTDNSGWVLSLSNTSVGPLAPYGGSDSSTSLSVTIPALGIDNVTVTATSQTDNTVSASDSCTAESTGVSISLNLVAGWNLVCFPVTGENNTPENIFAGLTDFVDYYIYSWSAPGGPYNIIGPTDVLQDNIGYWVFMTTTQTITWTGTQPTSRVENLVAGWNMAGFPIDNASTTAGNTFAGLTYFVDVYLYSWTAPGGPYNAIGPSDVLVDNTGYWVFLDTNKTITVPN